MGDVDKDGKHTLLDRRSWWKNLGTAVGPWTLHPVAFSSSGGSQMYV